MKTLIILLTLTLLTGFISTSGMDSRYLVFTIMGIAVIKLWLVAFQFMELKKAHIFWQGAMVFFGLTFLAMITWIS